MEEKPDTTKPDIEVPSAPELAELRKRLKEEVVFRERTCAEAVQAVLEKYGCMVVARDGAVNIVSRT